MTCSFVHLMEDAHYYLIFTKFTFISPYMLYSPKKSSIF